jgi:hypothetical protein
MRRFLWLGFVLSLYLICSGCGDTFRPIIIPNPPTFPNPAAAHTVVSINVNAPLAGQPEVVPGSAMVIDVSGDSVASIAKVGLAPVNAVQQSASVILVANHSVTGAVADSITKLNFSGTTISSTTTISLPPNSAPNFVTTTESTQAYVLLPSYVPDPINNPGVVVPSLGVVNTIGSSLIATLPVGNGPIAAAEIPNAKQVYVANQTDRTIDGFDINGQNLTLRVGSPVSTSSPPIWFSARSDSQIVYVLEGNGTGTLGALNVTATAGPDTLTEYPALAVAGANIMTYDPNLNRLYIPGGQELEIVDVSQSPPQLIAAIPIPPFALLNLPSANATAVAAAALPDGSRAYVGSYATLPSQLTVTAVSGDGTNATYAYTLTAGHDLTAGVSVTVTGTQQDGFDGTFIVGAIVSGTAACPGECFQVPNTTSLALTSVSASGTGSNIFPQVTVVWTTSNTIKTTAAVPGFPDATISSSPYYVPVCANTRDVVGPLGSGFRFMMGAGGDSSRAYLSSCDGGMVNIIDTSNDTYILNQPAPTGTRPPTPPSLQNPPQSPVFLIAGP